MVDPVADLLARLETTGGTLRAAGDVLEYEGPVPRLTPELRADIRAHRAELIRRLRPPLVPSLLARLADHGVWIALDERGCPHFHLHEGAGPDGVDDAVVDELHARVGELVAWLKKSAGAMSDEELAALRFGPNARDGRFAFGERTSCRRRTDDLPEAMK